MKKWSILLGICLVIQVVLAIGANLARTDYSAFKPMELLVPFDIKMVDNIHIEQDDNHQIELIKQEGIWRVSTLNNFQADEDKVENFLGKLAELKKGWPVATTVAAAKHFKVEKNDYERKITLSKDKKTINTLFIGTSPGFRKVHARQKNEKPVYAVKFNDYDASIKPEDWIDKGILKHQVSEISSVQLPDFSLSRKDDNLVVDGINENTEKTIAEEADRLLRKIADLRISAVIGTEPKSKFDQESPAFSYTLLLSSGTSEQYVFSKLKDADYYVLKPSHRDEYFKVDNWVVDGIKEISRSKIVRKSDTPQGTGTK